MAARQSQARQSQRLSQRTQPSQSSFSWQSSPVPDTQEVRDEIISLRNQSAHQGGRCNGRAREPDSEAPDPDGTGAERPSKRRKTPPTQPGHEIRKIVDLYHDLSDLLYKAQKHSILLLCGLDSAKTKEMDKIDFVGRSEDEIEEGRMDRKRCYRALKLLNTLVPGFEQKAIAAKNTANYCALLQTGANDARNDDTKKLKTAVAKWLNSRTAPTSHTRVSARGKDKRGINHDITGRLLCPIDYDWDDADVRAKLRNAEPGYNFTSSFFLRCLYEGESGDPNSPGVGFLKGPLLILAYRHMFMAPSSASGEGHGSETNSSRRRGIATTLCLNGPVTPRSIAYTATQLIFSLNTARDWKQEHAGFHYPTFYNFIVDFLEDTENDISAPHVKEILQWWNSNVFPPPARPTDAAVSSNAFWSSQKRLREYYARQTQARA